MKIGLFDGQRVAPNGQRITLIWWIGNTFPEENRVGAAELEPLVRVGINPHVASALGLTGIIPWG